MSQPNTVFLRLEGPLQSWGIRSRFVVRDSADVPSKSGVLGLICAAMGLRRVEANERLKDLADLKMGVRIDRSGTKIVDYNTAGARIGMLTAGGEIKRTGGKKTDPIETHVMRKEYLADAAFLVALQGDPKTVDEVAKALKHPEWPPFLGRKSCPPSVPVFAGSDTFDDLETALKSVPWRPRLDGFEEEPKPFRAVVEITPSEGEPVQDVPMSFTHRVYGIRWVKDVTLEKVPVGDAEFTEPPQRDGRPATSYPGWSDKTRQDGEPMGRRDKRLKHDYQLCVFCKQPARDVHHVSYARVGHEPVEDLRSVCSVCHDAMTLLEYAAGMAGDRIDPCDLDNRDAILAQRKKILTQRNRLRRNRALRTDEEDD